MKQSSIKTKEDKAKKLKDDYRRYATQFPTKEAMDVMIDGIPFKEMPIVHIKAAYNNTIMTLVDRSGQVVASSSSGCVGFQNAKKSTTIAAQTVSYDIAQKALFKEIKNVRVCVNGIGPGRFPGIKGLENAGLNIISITDSTKVPFNGNRPRKRRKI